MSFKTILVHVAGDEAGRARAEAAADLAERFDARLIGLASSAQPAPLVADGAGAAVGWWAEESARYEKEAWAAVDAFVERMRARGLSVEGRVAAGFEENASGAVALAGRYADLTVMGGRDAYESRGLADALIDAALFDSGRPAIVVPKGGATSFGERPMIAWDGGREAARAARDALPFLKTAASVTVCVARTYFGMGRHGEEPGADVARWLSGHGLKVEVEVTEPGDRSVADALAETARAKGCDMIVMGGFGHSRLRESIFGGVTASLISGPPLPLFLAH